MLELYFHIVWMQKILNNDVLFFYFTFERIKYSNIILLIKQFLDGCFKLLQKFNFCDDFSTDTKFKPTWKLVSFVVIAGWPGATFFYKKSHVKVNTLDGRILAYDDVKDGSSYRRRHMHKRFHIFIAFVKG